MKRMLFFALLGVITAAVLWTLLGGYNIAATEPHWKATETLFEFIRERSIERRSDNITVPNLDDQAMILAGAANYDAMCASCHLAPGIESSELHAGLYPQPPKLFKPQHDEHDPAASFWVIKHGIKMTGMPAWGPTHDDKEIWSMVAFLQKLPELNAEDYRQLVAQAKSSGHTHGGPGHHHGSSATGDDECDDGGHDHHHSAPADDKTESFQGNHEHGHQHHDPYGQSSTAGMTNHLSSSPEIAEVQQRMQAWAEAVNRMDLDAMERLVLDDASFMVVEGSHENLGWANYRDTHLKPEFKAMQAFSYRLLKTHVDVNANTAVVSFSYAITATMDDKNLQKVSRGTAIWKKVGDQWLLHYIHTS